MAQGREKAIVNKRNYLHGDEKKKGDVESTEEIFTEKI